MTLWKNSHKYLRTNELRICSLVRRIISANELLYFFSCKALLECHTHVWRKVSERERERHKGRKKKVERNGNIQYDNHKWRNIKKCIQIL